MTYIKHARFNSGVFIPAAEKLGKRGIEQLWFDHMTLGLLCGMFMLGTFEESKRCTCCLYGIEVQLAERWRVVEALSEAPEPGWRQRNGESLITASVCVTTRTFSFSCSSGVSKSLKELLWA